MSTFRRLIADGMGLDIYCTAGSGCGRHLDADVYDAAAIVGLDGQRIAARLPMRCRAYGSRDVRFKVYPDVRPSYETGEPHVMKPSRTPAERTAAVTVHLRRAGISPWHIRRARHPPLSRR